MAGPCLNKCLHCLSYYLDVLICLIKLEAVHSVSAAGGDSTGSDTSDGAGVGDAPAVVIDSTRDRSSTGRHGQWDTESCCNGGRQSGCRDIAGVGQALGSGRTGDGECEADIGRAGSRESNGVDSTGGVQVTDAQSRGAIGEGGALNGGGAGDVTAARDVAGVSETSSGGSAGDGQSTADIGSAGRRERTGVDRTGGVQVTDAQGSGDIGEGGALNGGGAGDVTAARDVAGVRQTMVVVAPLTASVPPTLAVPVVESVPELTAPVVFRLPPLRVEVTSVRVVL